MPRLPEPATTEPTEPPAPDAVDLVRAAQRGDRAAFGELYRRHARVVHGLLLCRLAPEDAEDVAQEVFLRAMVRLRALREPARFPAWLCTMARRAAIDLRRMPRRRAPHGPLPESLAAAERADGSARAILDAIRELPHAYRETLVLRLVEGMTGPEIAERTGLTPDSVRVNLSRGMKRLRARLSGAEP
jgi:RNA polymerase sigma-70 factor (ECF subfamily)